MKPAIGVVAAAAAGAAAMYFFDPAAGPQRRAAWLSQRGPVLLPVPRTPPAEAQRDRQASDAALIAAHEARLTTGIRDLIDGLGDDMDAITVSVEAGRVRLAGRVTPARRQTLIDGVADIVGSRNIVDALEARPAASGEVDGPEEAGSGGPGGGIGTGP